MAMPFAVAVSSEGEAALRPAPDAAYALYVCTGRYVLPHYPDRIGS